MSLPLRIANLRSAKSLTDCFAAKDYEHQVLQQYRRQHPLRQAERDSLRNAQLPPLPGRGGFLPFLGQAQPGPTDAGRQRGNIIVQQQVTL